MKRILETAADYRKKADDIWEQARIEHDLGHFELADILRDVSTSLHDIARKKSEIESLLKNSN